MTKFEVTHDGTKIAKERNRIANEISNDEIFIQTVYNALKVLDANVIEKLILAFSSIPETRVDFSLAKARLISFLDSLETTEEVPSEEITLLKHSIENINSLQELFAQRTESVNSPS